jgi:plastocyanin
MTTPASRFASAASAVLVSFLLGIAPGIARADVTIRTVFTDQFEWRFEPPDVTIERGETVTWLNGDGFFHTTTNGADFDDPNLGLLWDVVLDFEGAAASYTFGEAGFYPFLCRPHGVIGMVGSVTVVEPPPNSVESKTWGGIKALFR